MREIPLLVPFLLDASVPKVDQEGPVLPIRPTHVASWRSRRPQTTFNTQGDSVASSTSQSLTIALSTQDNSIYFITVPDTCDNVEPKDTIPTTTTGTIPEAGPSSPPPNLNSFSPKHSPRQRLVRPSQSRHTSSTGSNRSRAQSSASTLTDTSKRRVSAFSPPSSTHQAPLPTLSSAKVTISSTDTHGTSASLDSTGEGHHSHRHGSVTDRQELIDHLKEQRGPDKRTSEEGRGGLGLGIAGIGRRGLPNVHSKDEIENVSGTGNLTPKSTLSFESSRTTSRFKWSGKDVKQNEELEEQIEEIAVEREMEREEREEIKGLEEMKVVEKALRTPIEEGSLSGDDKSDGLVRRLVLRHPAEGVIVAMKVFEDLGCLYVLRDTGILDIISITSLFPLASINLEELEEPTPSNIASSSKTPLRIPPFWKWSGFHLAKQNDSSLIVVDGLPWPSPIPTHSGEVTRIIMISTDHSGAGEVIARLELPGEGHVGIVNSEDESYLLHAASTSMTSYPIHFPVPTVIPSTYPTPRLPSASTNASPKISTSPIIRSTTPNPPTDVHPLKRTASSQSLRSDSGVAQARINVEKGFAKFLAARRADWGGKDDKEAGKDVPAELGVGIGEGKEVERDGYGDWRIVRFDSDGTGVGVGNDGVDVLFCDGKQLSVKGSIKSVKKSVVKDAFANQSSDCISVLNDKGISIYRLQQKASSSPGSQSRSYTESRTLPGVSVATLDPSGCLTVVGSTSVDTIDLSPDTLSETRRFLLAPETSPKRTHLTPFDLDTFFVSDATGTVTKQALDDLLNGQVPSSDDEIGIDRLASPVTTLNVFASSEIRGGKVVVAGDEDGVIRIWEAQPFKLAGSWTLFADPVKAVTLLDMPESGSLRGSLLCVSLDGTIGLISLKEIEETFLIPASRAPLRRIFVGGSDILLAYSNGKARVWNVETMEFRRSTGLDAAEDMLQGGKWAEVDLGSASSDLALSATAYPTPVSSDQGRMLNLDLRQLSRWLHYATSNTLLNPLNTLRTLLSIFLTFDISHTMDDICIKHLGIPRPRIPISSGISAQHGATTLCPSQGAEAWTISPQVSGMRQLVIVSLLRPFLDSPDLERWAAEVIAFYTASLPDGFVEPELDFFADYYLDSASDVHQAARMLFGARLARMSTDEIEDLVQARQAELPSLVSTDKQQSDQSARALMMIGGMALHKYQSMSPTALKAASESLELYLHDPTCPHLAHAIELCSKGFSIWQTYVDPMELLRRLFHLATRKESSSSSSSTTTAAQARLAVLHVASSNTPLFMSTLSMDILDAKSAEGRNSIMKLCVYMARKRPAVLENGLPRIAEAVVKSLDPNIGKMRDEVWEAATVILNELVLAFSTIDFNSGTQRLAVGTHEGAVILYDLKTASRLYILEPHKHPVSAVTFSPDGRRLITVSLEEGSVTVWKVGSSLSGFFNVGGPPRQGSKAGEPFKRIAFMRADDAPMDSMSALSDIQISWPGARQARVKIKETALTFET